MCLNMFQIDGKDTAIVLILLLTTITYNLTYPATYSVSRYTIKYHINDTGSLNKHLGKSGGGSFNWYSYLESHLAVPKHLAILE